MSKRFVLSQPPPQPLTANSLIHLPSPIPALSKVYRVRESGSETQSYICLDRNERLQPLPDWFMEALRQAIDSQLLTSYPIQDPLLDLLAAQWQLPKSHLLLTPGSDGAIKALYQAYLHPGDGIVMLQPSYAMYPVYTQLFQAQAIQIPFAPDLSVDPHHLLAAIEPGVRLVMLANPNQPTGTLLEPAVLHQICQQAARVGALVAVDEAYYPFSQTTVVPWVQHYPHLVAMRTFSKAAGLAGLRLGAVAAHPQVVGNLFKVRSAYDVNSLAIVSAFLVLTHPQIVSDYVAEVKAGQEILEQGARSLGLVPLPTHTNFRLIRVGHCCTPGDLVAALRDRGYLVKGPFDAPCLAGCIRVTVGPPDLMAAFITTLQACMAALMNQTIGT
ncbi:pyridoxal phosphate-dependent aminotransferase [Neosynechococcus sphagnicola]|uniref:pyridoxal phosphate-dependent aminotransferase n=1 Tax=Neosynechococcus sphagnicola TaxID=1501145 RepID=UPI0019553B5A|nr:histidinol-phosphate transaminase [Neosynechococcus sphagnicola]